MLEDIEIEKGKEDKKWLTEGTILDGRYRVLQLIKAGGMGAVYRVADLKMGERIMALKQMLESFSDQSAKFTAVNRFLTEVQVLTELRHPNIPQITDHFALDGSFFFVMDYVEGRDMSQILKAEGSPGLDEQRVALIATEVCSALHYIHNLEVPFAHRDIKPSNLILRASDNKIMLIDFGIARVTNPSEGFWIGTPGYASPEQQIGKPEPRSDLYALGASMHEMLTGKRPDGFDFPHFSEFGVTVSPKLEAILSDALAWNPDERIQTAKEFKKRLTSFLGYSPSESTKSDGFLFTEAVQEFKSKFLDTKLNDLMKRYVNECHTTFIPKNLDYLTLTLACPMSFDLIIKKNDTNFNIEFFYKEGILAQTLLGSIDPFKDSKEKLDEIVDNFIDKYENFKSGAWGIS